MSTRRPLRIAIFLPGFGLGGAELVAVSLANAWRKKGIDVDFVAMEGDGPLRVRLPAHTHVEDVGRKGYRGAIPSLARYLNDREPEVLLGTLYMTDVVAVLAAKLARHRPVIVLGAHNNLGRLIAYPTGNKDRWLLRPLSALTFRFADAIVAVSTGVARDLERRLFLRGGSVRTIYNPVIGDDVSTRIAAASPHPWLTRPRDFSLILSLGRLVEQKGLDVLLDAFARLAGAPRLLIAGGGPLDKALRAQASELEIADRVNFIGIQSNPYALMARSDLFVLPSRWEGMGNTIVEAMAAGCPVVASDCDFGPSELLGGGAYGWLTPVGDARGLAATIGEALAAPTDDFRKDRARLATRAASFHREHAADAYLELFGKLITINSGRRHDSVDTGVLFRTR